jgi:transcriptional regulator with XRE-family HTH domain
VVLNQVAFLLRLNLKDVCTILDSRAKHRYTVGNMSLPILNPSPAERDNGAELVLGAAIKDRRLARGFTQEQLGKRAGVSKSFVSRLENGTVSPSIPTLLAIARVLEASVGELFDLVEERASKTPVIVTAKERKTVARGGTAFGYAYELLAREGNSVMEPFVVHFPPGTKPRRWFVHNGHEFNLVLQGKMDFYYSDKVYLLEEGDSVYFDSSVPHTGVARGPEEVSMVAILIDL